MSYPANPEHRLGNAPSPEREIWNALRTVEDPELPVSVVDLGLIYDISVEDGTATIAMTLTYSGCPARDLIVDDVTDTAAALETIEDISVSIVYSPQWSPSRITDRGRDELTDFGLAVPETGPAAEGC